MAAAAPLPPLIKNSNPKVGTNHALSWSRPAARPAGPSFRPGAPQELPTSTAMPRDFFAPSSWGARAPRATPGKAARWNRHAVAETASEGRKNESQRKRPWQAGQRRVSTLLQTQGRQSLAPYGCCYSLDPQKTRRWLSYKEAEKLESYKENHKCDLKGESTFVRKPSAGNLRHRI